MFKFLGCLVAAYAAMAIAKGKVSAAASAWEVLRTGQWWLSFSRKDAPFRYWGTVAVYCLLALALLTVF
jgi:hypothetical protein